MVVPSVGHSPAIKPTIFSGVFASIKVRILFVSVVVGLVLKYVPKEDSVLASGLQFSLWPSGTALTISAALLCIKPMQEPYLTLIRSLPEFGLDKRRA